jgi:hypothetical protein
MNELDFECLYIPIDSLAVYKRLALENKKYEIYV